MNVNCSCHIIKALDDTIAGLQLPKLLRVQFTLCQFKEIVSVMRIADFAGQIHPQA